MPPDFGEIKRVCHGMMGAETYQRIHETAKGADGPAVEVGTGHGAATISIALAGRRVFSFDRFEGGSRSKYGGKDDNLAIVRAALKRFGVSHLVEILAGDVAKQPVPGGEFGMLVLDADGRIDRDFALFFDRLKPGSPIVLDDHADKVRTRRKGQGLRIDQKHRLTFLLANSAEKHGLIEGRGKVKDTWFGVKREARFSDWPTEAILGCYRKLVFADAPSC